MAPPLIVLRVAGSTATLVRAAMRVADVADGPIAVVGGIAVTCRLQTAHRATSDVDAVVEDRSPTVVEVLAGVDGMKLDASHRNRIWVDGIKVDVIPTGPVDDVEGLTGTGLLFVLTHRYTLETAERCRLVVQSAEARTEGWLPVATPAALLGMKLGAIQERRGWDRPEKQASDGYDLYRLLNDLDEEGAIAQDVIAKGEPLRSCIREAAETVLIRDASKTVNGLRVYGSPAMAAVSVDDIKFVTERFLDRLANP